MEVVEEAIWKDFLVEEELGLAQILLSDSWQEMCFSERTGPGPALAVHVIWG